MTNCPRCRRIRWIAVHRFTSYYPSMLCNLLCIWIFAHAEMGSSQRWLATNQTDKQVHTKGELHAWNKCWTGWIGNKCYRHISEYANRNPLTRHDTTRLTLILLEVWQQSALRIVDAMGQGHSSDLHPLNILSFCDWPHRGICTQLSSALRSSLQLEDGQGHLVLDLNSLDLS